MKMAVGEDTELGENELLRFAVVEAMGGEHYRKSVDNCTRETRVCGEDRARDL